MFDCWLRELEMGIGFIRGLLAAAMLVSLAVPPAYAASPADFYKGRTVQLIVGFSSGGGYDLYARTLARHMGKHIPGNPTLVPQNMPGAGSLKAANYLYNVAAEGRHRVRHFRPRHSDGAAARPHRGRAIRRYQIHLDRQRHRRTRRLRVLGEVGHPHLCRT